MLSGFSCVWLFVTPWTVAHQIPLSLGSPSKNTKWVAISSSRGSSRPRDWTRFSYIAGGVFIAEPLGKSHICLHKYFLCVKNNYIFQNKKINLIRRLVVFYTSALTSGLTEDSWILLSGSAFNLLQYHTCSFWKNSNIHLWKMRMKIANTVSDLLRE